MSYEAEQFEKDVKDCDITSAEKLSPELVKKFGQMFLNGSKNMVKKYNGLIPMVWHGDMGVGIKQAKMKVKGIGKLKYQSYNGYISFVVELQVDAGDEIFKKAEVEWTNTNETIQRAINGNPGRISVNIDAETREGKEVSYQVGIDL